MARNLGGGKFILVKIKWSKNAQSIDGKGVPKIKKTR